MNPQATTLDQPLLNSNLEAMFEPMPDTSSDRILVINPNSTEAVTRGIDAAMEPLRITGGPAIECVTLKDGPPGIENQAHAEQVVPLVGAMVKKRDNDCSAFVIACYSDPGLHAARELTAKPVLGIAECGILTALTLGQRFGVISILRKSIPRHLRYVGQMGLTDRMAGDRAIGLGVVELSDETRTFSRMAEVAAELRDEDGADVLVMGCAGMARYRDRLQRHVGLPVVEPSQAAVSMAIGRSRLAWA
jgi:allantoin racemase